MKQLKDRYLVFNSAVTRHVGQKMLPEYAVIEMVHLLGHFLQLELELLIPFLHKYSSFFVPPH